MDHKRSKRSATSRQSRCTNVGAQSKLATHRCIELNGCVEPERADQGTNGRRFNGGSNEALGVP
jgi:hypothetical protein